MTFCLPPGEQFLGYPVAGPDNDLRPGHRRYNVVWYRPADEDRPSCSDLLTDEQRHDPHDLDPAAADPARDAIDADARRRRAVAGAAIPRDRAHDRRADPAADLRSRNAAHGVRPGRDHRRCGFRRATACRGRGRQGGGRRGGVGGGARRRATSRRRCDASRPTRLPVGQRIIERARHLGAYLQATQTAEERARSQRHSIPEAVLAETAVLDFLRE